MRAISLSSLCRFILGLGWGKRFGFLWSEGLFFWYIVVLSAGAWKEECAAEVTQPFWVSVLFLLPPYSIIVQKFRGFNLEHLVKVCLYEKLFFFFKFHYIVFNFLSKNNAFDDLAVVAAQNKLKGCHCAVFSLDSKGLFNMQVFTWFWKIEYAKHVSNLLERIKVSHWYNQVINQSKK